MNQSEIIIINEKINNLSDKLAKQQLEIDINKQKISVLENELMKNQIKNGVFEEKIIENSAKNCACDSEKHLSFACEQKNSILLLELEKSQQSVESIKYDNIMEVCSLKICPEPIIHVMTVILTLFDIHDFSWIAIKTFLQNRNFKEEIINYDVHRITPAKILQIFSYIMNHTSSFDSENIKMVSIAIAPLAMWAKTILAYSDYLTTREIM